MYLCYIDESGTPEVPGNTSHFVLAGLSLPISYWRSADREISLTLGKYGLENEELHTAWMIRKYLEQSKIADFEALDWLHRRAAVQQYRTKELLRLQKVGSGPYRQAKKNYEQTKAYIHLTRGSLPNVSIKPISIQRGQSLRLENKLLSRLYPVSRAIFHILRQPSPRIQLRSFVITEY
jgi:hypothetical protein